MDLTYEEFGEKLQEAAEERGDWAGYPMPTEQFRLVLEPRFPYPGLNGKSWENLDGEPAAEDEADEEFDLVNSWNNLNRNVSVTIVRSRKTGRIEHFTHPLQIPSERLKFRLDTIGASRVWSLKAELKAIDKLSTIITPQAFKYYLLTGGFLETSPRSRVTYWFRKGLPTVAIGFGVKGESRILAALCLHPIGYYEETFAGCMVPTDDVIAHLTMMRGDERKFWAKSEHHTSVDPRSGI